MTMIDNFQPAPHRVITVTECTRCDWCSLVNQPGEQMVSDEEIEAVACTGGCYGEMRRDYDRHMSDELPRWQDCDNQSHSCTDDY
jgi:DNA gyrase inhibitor GyrI